MHKCNLKRHSDHRFCCALCGRAFSSMVPFDWHQKLDPDRGVVECLDPSLALRGGEPRFKARETSGYDGIVWVWGSAREYAGPRS